MNKTITIYLQNGRDIKTQINLEGVAPHTINEVVEREMVKIGQVGYFIIEDNLKTYYPANQIVSVEVQI